MDDNSINKSQLDALPPSDVRFLDLQVEPWEDKTRLKILAQLTPFSKFPNLEFSIKCEDGSIIAQSSIIENIESKFVFTMHLRSRNKPGPYILIGIISYEDIGVVDQKTYKFEV
jgi:hypothetical protein